MLNNRDAFLTMDLPDVRVVDVCPLLWGRATLVASLDRLTGGYEHLWEQHTGHAAPTAARTPGVGWTMTSWSRCAPWGPQDRRGRLPSCHPRVATEPGGEAGESPMVQPPWGWREMKRLGPFVKRPASREVS